MITESRTSFVDAQAPSVDQSSGCTREKNCQYEHVQEGVDVAVQSAKVVEPSAPSSVDKPIPAQPEPEFRRPCHFFAQSGRCKFGDQCIFRHDLGMADAPTGSDQYPVHQSGNVRSVSVRGNDSVGPLIMSYEELRSSCEKKLKEIEALQSTFSDGDFIVVDPSQIGGPLSVRGIPRGYAGATIRSDASEAESRWGASPSVESIVHVNGSSSRDYGAVPILNGSHEFQDRRDGFDDARLRSRDGSVGANDTVSRVGDARRRATVPSFVGKGPRDCVRAGPVDIDGFPFDARGLGLAPANGGRLSDSRSSFQSSQRFVVPVNGAVPERGSRFSRNDFPGRPLVHNQQQPPKFARNPMGAANAYPRPLHRTLPEPRFESPSSLSHLRGSYSSSVVVPLHRMTPVNEHRTQPPNYRPAPLYSGTNAAPAVNINVPVPVPNRLPSSTPVPSSMNERPTHRQNQNYWPPEICWNFARHGQCNWGLRCRHLHVSPAEFAEICRDFARYGQCKLGPQCHRLHIPPAESAPASVSAAAHVSAPAIVTPAVEESATETPRAMPCTPRCGALSPITVPDLDEPIDHRADRPIASQMDTEKSSNSGDEDERMTVYEECLDTQSSASEYESASSGYGRSALHELLDAPLEVTRLTDTSTDSSENHALISSSTSLLSPQHSLGSIVSTNSTSSQDSQSSSFSEESQTSVSSKETSIPSPASSTPDLESLKGSRAHDGDIQIVLTERVGKDQLRGYRHRHDMDVGEMTLPVNVNLPPGSRGGETNKGLKLPLDCPSFNVRSTRMTMPYQQVSQYPLHPRPSREPSRDERERCVANGVQPRYSPKEQNRPSSEDRARPGPVTHRGKHAAHFPSNDVNLHVNYPQSDDIAFEDAQTSREFDHGSESRVLVKPPLKAEEHCQSEDDRPVDLGVRRGVCHYWERERFCPYGDKCKYTHKSTSDADGEGTAVCQRPCFVWMATGHCRTLACPFSHDPKDQGVYTTNTLESNSPTLGYSSGTDSSGSDTDELMSSSPPPGLIKHAAAVSKTEQDKRVWPRARANQIKEMPRRTDESLRRGSKENLDALYQLALGLNATKIEKQREIRRKELEAQKRKAESLRREEQERRRVQEQEERRRLDMEARKAEEVRRAAAKAEADKCVADELVARKADAARADACRTFTRVLNRTTIVTFEAGLKILGIVPGFESCQMRIRNLPANFGFPELISLCTSSGAPRSQFQATSLRHVRTDSTEAYLVADAEVAEKLAVKLEGYDLRGSTLQAGILSGGKHHASSQSAAAPKVLPMSLRLPYLRFRVRFSSREEAERKLQKLNGSMCGKRRVRVEFDDPFDEQSKDLRVVGASVDMKDADLAQFCGVKSVERMKGPSYDVDDAVKFLRHHVESQAGAGLDNFEVTSKENPEGYIRFLATFATSDLAEKVHESLEGKRMWWTSNIPIQIRLSERSFYAVTIPKAQYDAQRKRWSELEKKWSNDGRSQEDKRACSLRVIHRDDGKVVVRVVGEDNKTVGALKIRVDTLAAGDTCDHWHPGFASEHGDAFLKRLCDLTKVYARIDVRIRAIRVYGSKGSIQRARAMVRDEAKRLSSLEYTVPLKRSAVKFFVQQGVQNLKSTFGDDKASLDLTVTPCTLTVGGGEDIRHAVQQLIIQASTASLSPSKSRKVASCPICYDTVEAPVELGCGHVYCTGCLRHYLLSAQDTKKFPLTCVASVSKKSLCSCAIPIPTIQRFLPPTQFEHLLEVAFTHHVEQNPQVYKYCKTPDCVQIYRWNDPKFTDNPRVVHCPSCLLDICSACHEDEHAGMSCAERRLQKSTDHQERLAKEWAASHDVKTCPKCGIQIEKTEGCNHMACRCGAHICWTCMGTFDANEIYWHMTTAHGTIGGGQDVVIDYAEQVVALNQLERRA